MLDSVAASFSVSVRTPLQSHPSSRLQIKARNARVRLFLSAVGDFNISLKTCTQEVISITINFRFLFYTNFKER